VVLTAAKSPGATVFASAISSITMAQASSSYAVEALTRPRTVGAPRQRNGIFAPLERRETQETSLASIVARIKEGSCSI